MDGCLIDLTQLLDASCVVGSPVTALKADSSGAGRLDVDGSATVSDPAGAGAGGVSVGQPFRRLLGKRSGSRRATERPVGPLRPRWKSRRDRADSACRRSCVRAGLTTLALLIVSLGHGAPARGAAFDERVAFMGGDYFDVFSARANGTDLRPVTDCANNANDCVYAMPALSPDGQTIAVEAGWPSITLMNVDGTNRRVLINDETHMATLPAWSPDGQAILYTRTRDDNGAWNEDLYSVRADGSNASDPTPVVTGPGDQEFGDYSSNGTMLTYDGQDPPDQQYKLHVLNLQTHDTQVVDTSTLTDGSAAEPKFSPDGTKIVFYAPPRDGAGSDTGVGQVFVVDANGNNLQRLTTDGVADWSPHWSPDGHTIVYDRACPEPGRSGCGGASYQTWSMTDQGSDQHHLIASPYPQGDVSGEQSATYRKASSAMTQDKLLADAFRPIMKFDSQERWRPLNVDSFFAEKDPSGYGDHPLNDICDANSCTSGLERTQTWQDLRDHAGPLAHIDVGNVSGGDSPSAYDYKSPYAQCNALVAVTLLDCNGDEGTSPIEQNVAQSRTSGYYHVLPSVDSGTTTAGGYNYIDYWYYYRYNHFPVDDHQGDWEGITVAPSRSTPGTFDYASYAQHTYQSNYLHDNLICDAGGPASCGSDDNKSGGRVWVFPAQGSHASYPFPDDCGGLVPVCWQPATQTAPLLLPEGSHDGLADWGQNTTDPAIGGGARQFPAGSVWNDTTVGNGAAAWTDWPGQWGHDVASPQSPGNQKRFDCPWWSNPDDSQSTHLDGTPCRAAGGGETKAASALSRSSERATPQHAQRRDASSANSCPNWFGTGVVAVACSPSRLRGAIGRGALGRHGTLRLGFTQSKRGHTAAATGVAQAVGRPLRQGETMRLTGRASTDAELYVRAVYRNVLYLFRFTHLGLSRGGRLLVRAQVRRGTFVVGAERSERTHIIRASAERRYRLPARLPHPALSHAGLARLRAAQQRQHRNEWVGIARLESARLAACREAPRRAVAARQHEHWGEKHANPRAGRHALGTC